ncbi:hypothetical protein Moror_14174 [Moniliophthora roreri MCA 2997]|uniref:Uncharacterized protein n=1 Tax=Moniliophthora roreri (strain MCA 2997) TaxID=1381753 RepID=V2XPJ5_MONRO|nr:hypothetical protein Moror_14174 [Moniliophthora roreri MCA 2997]
MIHSVELAVILFILAVTDDPRSARHTINILSSISIIFHHVIVILIYLDKRTSESETGSNVERQPLLPFLRHVMHSESSDPRAGLLIVVSLFQLIASSIAGAVMASKRASWSDNALAQTVVQIVECFLLGALALTTLAKLFVGRQQQNPEDPQPPSESTVRARMASQNPI